jgi:hypothetical protein
MRYLSHVLVLSQTPHVKEICVVDMLARTCKKLCNRNIADLITENKVEYEQLLKVKDKNKYHQQ